MEVVVLEVDPANRRLSLGHKQLEENPWDVFETMFTEGSVHEGTVMKINDKGAIIAMPYGIEAYSPLKHIVKADTKSLKEDEKAEFKVLEFNKESKRILVSHRAIHEEVTMKARSAEHVAKDQEKENTSQTVKRMKDSSEKSTLGDLTALTDIKINMDAAEKKKSKRKAPAHDEAVAPETPASESTPEAAEEKKEEKSEE